MTLTFGSGPTTLDFDFYVSSGSTQSQTKPGDLTLYAISTDPVDSTHPALSGSMAYQVPMSSGYTNASFNGTSVSALTGANANVSLTVGQTDGTSGGTGGTGGLTGSFDQNNNGTIISAAAFPGGSQTTNPYTYVATSSAGRYIFYLLGNPTGSSPVNPIPFVLYASGANRGFLLDQNSSSVITELCTRNPPSRTSATLLPSCRASSPPPLSATAIPALRPWFRTCWSPRPEEPRPCITSRVPRTPTASHWRDRTR